MEPGSRRPERSSEQRRSFCGLQGAEKPGQDGRSEQSTDNTPAVINRISETEVSTLPPPVHPRDPCWWVNELMQKRIRDCSGLLTISGLIKGLRSNLRQGPLSPMSDEIRVAAARLRTSFILMCQIVFASCDVIIRTT